MAFVGHDTGHNAVTHSNATDSLAGLVVGNLTTGIGEKNRVGGGGGFAKVV